MPWIIDSVLALLVLVGALLVAAAGFGLLRGTGAAARVQGVAKAGSVGAILLLVVAAIAAGDLAVFMRSLAAAALILVNAALTSQILAEAAEAAAEGIPPQIDRDQNR